MRDKVGSWETPARTTRSGRWANVSRAENGVLRRAVGVGAVVALLALVACRTRSAPEPAASAHGSVLPPVGASGASSVPRAEPSGSSCVPSASGGMSVTLEANAFRGVMSGTLEEPDINIHPVGSRALVTLGPRVLGYVEPGGDIVQDRSLSKGLPRLKGRTVSPIVGRWPGPLGALQGSFTGSGNPGNHHAFLYRTGSWFRVDAAPGSGWDKPHSAAIGGGALWVFVPVAFHFNDGVLPDGSYPCSGVRRLGIERVSLSRRATMKPSMIEAWFFPMAVVGDAAEHAFVWGFSACSPGVFVGALGADRVDLELVPGTDTCRGRNPTSGLPALEAELFPANGGGLYALVHPPWDDDLDGGPGCRVLTLHHRDASGVWSARVLDLRSLPRIVPEESLWHSQARVIYVDPDGVLWLATSRPSVLRVDQDGKVRELGFAESCSRVEVDDELGEHQILELDSGRPIEAIVAASPGDIWIVGQHGSVTNLCRLASTAPTTAR
jgi:hypothetical protein